MATKSQSDLQTLVAKAHDKLSTDNDKDLCRYLPGNRAGYYMHHFTFRKVALNSPKELGAEIKKHILDVAKPKALPSAPRALRGSGRKGGGKNNNGDTTIELSGEQLARLLQYARSKSDSDLENALLSGFDNLPLEKLKRELIQSIRKNTPSRALFEALGARLASGS